MQGSGLSVAFLEKSTDMLAYWQTTDWMGRGSKPLLLKLYVTEFNKECIILSASAGITNLLEELMKTLSMFFSEWERKNKLEISWECQVPSISLWLNFFPDKHKPKSKLYSFPLSVPVYFSTYCKINDHDIKMFNCGSMCSFSTHGLIDLMTTAHSIFQGHCMYFHHHKGVIISLWPV